MILAGRIDSGRVHLALYRPDGSGPHLLRSASLPADEHGGLRQILRRFVAEDLPALRAACIAVSGPAVEGLARALGSAEVEVVDADSSLEDLARRAFERIGGAG